MDLSFELEGRRIKIIVDGELYKQVSVTLFGKRPSFPKFFQDLEEIEAFFQDQEYRRGRDYALRCLCKRHYLTCQLKGKLQEKLVSDATVDQILGDCQKYGYLDDEAYIESTIRQCLSRHDGPQKIITKLQTKGVPFLLAKERVDALVDDSGEQIRHLLQTRYKRYDLKDYTQRQKVIVALQRKGFPLDIVLNTVGNQ